MRNVYDMLCAGLMGTTVVNINSVPIFECLQKYLWLGFETFLPWIMRIFQFCKRIPQNMLHMSQQKKDELYLIQQEYIF